jgi:membrane-bound lytic murein transglycosylase B
MIRRLPLALSRLDGLRRLAALCGVLVTVACATTVPKPSPPAQPSASIPIAPPPLAGTGNAKFDAFVLQARGEALASGIRPEVFDQAVAGIAPIASIAASNANQPEFSRPVWSYLDSAVSARRVKDAQVMLARQGAVLDTIAARYGVPKEILVAIWGMESDFGADAGGVNLFAALATLAYDGPRMAYARPEFFAALRLYQEQHYRLGEMVGSWAGAFGQTQFTPTTFFKYAADGDGDGRIDLWQSAPDALASSARLLSAQGWKSGEGWGTEVRLPGGFPYEQADTDTQKSIRDWRALGVKTVDGAPLASSDAQASIYLPAGTRGPAFLLLANFNVILKYNNAASYALAVGLLADRMAGAGPVHHAWPRDERPLSRDERVRFQSELTGQGFDAGSPDGVLGRKSRNALRAWQKAHGLAADGFATAALLQLLDKDSTR